MTILESILAFMAGEAQSLPATTNTEEERLLKKAAQRLVGGLVPTPENADNGKILTAGASGAFAWADAPTELPAVTAADAGAVLTVNESGAWAAVSPTPAET